MTFGLLRVKNESRWLTRVLLSIMPICERIILFDDNSQDDTAMMAEALCCTVLRSPFTGVDETRDKNYLLDACLQMSSPGDWALMIDGDEELHRDDQHIIVRATTRPKANAYSLRILYLWNEPDMVRIDGVYQNFRRPSLFRLIGRSLGELNFRRSGNGGNFHCGSIPQQLINQPCVDLSARLLHWGYFDEALRKQKFDFYNRVDPNNTVEDGYRHITQGDPAGAPADARLVHAGPLRLARI